MLKLFKEKKGGGLLLWLKINSKKKGKKKGDRPHLNRSSVLLPQRKTWSVSVYSDD